MSHKNSMIKRVYRDSNDYFYRIFYMGEIINEVENYEEAQEIYDSYKKKDVNYVE